MTPTQPSEPSSSGGQVSETILLSGDIHSGVHIDQYRYEQYHHYLETIKDRLPTSAYAFASAPWHYDPMDPRCPHDSWLKTLAIEEVATGERQEVREVQVTIRLLNAHHTGEVQITYHNITRYEIHMHGEAMMGNNHGDWLIDEVRLTDTSRVVHEIVFASSRMLFECGDIVYDWRPEVA
jgi:hypothetical protein